MKVVDDQTITKAADALNQKLMAVEENLVELKVRAVGSKLAKRVFQFDRNFCQERVPSCVL